MDEMKTKALLLKKLMGMANETTASKLGGKFPMSTAESQSPIKKDNSLYDMSVQYVEAARKSLDIKPTVRVATTENIDLKGIQSIDGVKTSEGDRILVKNQNKAGQNGIYVITAGNWSRSVDADEDYKLRNNVFTYVEEGSVNGGSSFSARSPVGYQLNVSPLKFEVFKDKTPAVSPVKTGATFSTFHKDIAQSEGTNDQGAY